MDILPVGCKGYCVHCSGLGWGVWMVLRLFPEDAACAEIFACFDAVPKYTWRCTSCN